MVPDTRRFWLGLICLIYRQGFKTALPALPQIPATPFSGSEIRTAIITLGTLAFKAI